MKKFILKHPYLFTFFVLPGAFFGVAQVVAAFRGKPDVPPHPRHDRLAEIPPPAKE